MIFEVQGLRLQAIVFLPLVRYNRLDSQQPPLATVNFVVATVNFVATANYVAMVLKCDFILPSFHSDLGLF